MKSITMNCNKYYLALFCGALAAGCLTSCSEEVSVPDTPASGRATNFVTLLTESATDTQGLTRASGGSWDAGDQVGIYMAPSVASATAPADLSSATYSNVPYKVLEAGHSASLQAVNGNNVILYPDDGHQVNFVAYYPYRDDITNNIYKVNVSNQSPTTAIDLCYHKGTGTTYSNKSSGAVPLSFTHQLSKMKLSIDLGDIDVNKVTLTLRGFPSTADFDLSTGTFNELGGTDALLTPVKKEAASSTETRVDYEALLVPHAANANYSRVVTFTIESESEGESESYSYTLGNGKYFQSGGSHKYTFRFTGIDIVPILTGSLTDWDTTNEYESIALNPKPEPLLLDSRANCIMVPSGNAQGLSGGFAFDIDPQVATYHTYANGNRRLNPLTLLGENDTWTASILWMDGKDLIELDVDACSGKGPKGQVRFWLPIPIENEPVSGNVLIEVKKNGGATVWSWHLWILPGGLETLTENRTTYTSKNLTYAGGAYKKEYTMLNYNLGATKTGKPTTGDYSGSGSHPTFGLYYQWGRKDPFPNTGEPGWEATGYYTATGEMYIVPTTTANTTLLHTLQHPNEFCSDYEYWIGSGYECWSGSDGDYSWGGYDDSGYANTDNPAGYFTQVDKTPFDPCPVGYRVPPAGAFDSDGGDSQDDNSLYGYSWSNSNPGPVPATFPASGYRNYRQGRIYNQGTNGHFWAASPSVGNYYGFYLSLSNTYVSPQENDFKNSGFSVRCIAE